MCTRASGMERNQLAFIRGVPRPPELPAAVWIYKPSTMEDAAHSFLVVDCLTMLDRLPSRGTFGAFLSLASELAESDLRDQLLALL